MKVITHLVKWKNEPGIYFTTNVRGKRAGWPVGSSSGMSITCSVNIKPDPGRKRPRRRHELIGTPEVSVESAIRFIRNQRVMLDRDVARLYRVSTKALNQAVKRNPNLFPADFMFRLSKEEANALESASSKSQRIHQKKFRGTNNNLPYAFTEHGILTLSGVLQSERAVAVSISIVRAFVRLRETVASNSELNKRLDELERSCDGQFQIVFKTIKKLMRPSVHKRKPTRFVSSKTRKSSR